MTDRHGKSSAQPARRVIRAAFALTAAVSAAFAASRHPAAETVPLLGARGGEGELETEGSGYGIEKGCGLTNMNPTVDGWRAEARSDMV
jgi:hypothetical protein